MIRDEYRQSVDEHRADIEAFKPVDALIVVVDARGAQLLGEVVLEAAHKSLGSLENPERAILSLATKEAVIDALSETLFGIGVARIDVQRGREVRHLRLEQSARFVVPGTLEERVGE